MIVGNRQLPSRLGVFVFGAVIIWILLCVCSGWIWWSLLPSNQQDLIGLYGRSTAIRIPTLQFYLPAIRTMPTSDPLVAHIQHLTPNPKSTSTVQRIGVYKYLRESVYGNVGFLAFFLPLVFLWTLLAVPCLIFAIILYWRHRRALEKGIQIKGPYDCDLDEFNSEQEGPGLIIEAENLKA